MFKTKTRAMRCLTNVRYSYILCGGNKGLMIAFSKIVVRNYTLSFYGIYSIAGFLEARIKASIKYCLMIASL